VVTFSFVDPGLMTLASFETHLLAYGTLFCTLPLLNFVYIATRSTHSESARKLFFSIRQKAPNIDPGEQAVRYFTLRKLWEAKRYGKLNDDDLEFLNRATKQYNDPLTDIRYHQWLSWTRLLRPDPRGIPRPRAQAGSLFLHRTRRRPDRPFSAEPYTPSI